MEVLVVDTIVVGFVVDGDINDERSVDVLSLAAAVEPKISLVFLLLLILNQMKRICTKQISQLMDNSIKFTI